MNNHIPIDAKLAERYVTGATSGAEDLWVEQAMDRSPQWRALVGSQISTERLEFTFAGIEAELDAPARGRVERFLVRVGVREHIARLMMATPVLRRSWYLASFLVLFFGIAAASPDRADGSLSLFLALAPLVPVLGVALAYGPGVDPAHDMTVATPLSGFRLVLLRSVAVLGTSVAFGGLASLMIAADEGARVVAWMLPALALTSATLALSTILPTRVAAGITGGVWLVLVSIVTQASGDLKLFGAPAQLGHLVVAAVAAGVLVLRRDAFDAAEVTP